MRERHNRSMDDRQGLGPGISAEVITRCGKAAGLTTCGVADCGPSDHGSWLDRWLSAGAHGSMAWMERTAAIRKELTSKWDWARSALVGTVSYLTEPVDRRRLPGIGPFIARYARGRDYHDLLRERLADWCEAIEKAAGRSFRRALLVDTSAILERELALRAGLGWIGKNTCLIGPRGDSWRLIGVVLTDLPPLPPVPPAADRCGTCRACLDACPTGALPEPYFLDARRCISYLTIEHRGEIEAEMEPAVGDWLFGCDICQEVCPWNRRVVPSGEEALALDPRWSQWSLGALARLDPETWRREFRKTPLGRPRRGGLVRNALVVGANLGDPDVLAAARELVDDEDPQVAATARRVLERRK
ncbi:MAG: tRNA epoxyqueuosine(34) reductase QueG [Acidobacteriota bacterium]|nr:tRNA epoxyqueuosine(34) reductase QueG [Acidobacteriota bacterium]